MPFCPQCQTEYIAGTANCADCNIALIDHLPEPVTYDECENCRGEIEEDNDFCPHCGVLFTDRPFHCDTHRERNADAVCVICHRLLCVDCINDIGKKMFCSAHTDIEISEDWAVIFRSTDFYEAQIIRGKLENAGITVNPQNTTNLGFMADGIIDNTFGRAILKYPVKVFVPLHQYLDALDVVNDVSSE